MHFYNVNSGSAIANSEVFKVEYFKMKRILQLKKKQLSLEIGKGKSFFIYPLLGK